MVSKAINPVCIEIGKINIHRNRHSIPHSWYSNLKTEGGNTDIIGALILADTVYWYTPTDVLSEKTGKVVSQKQKFKLDKLQRSYKYFENLFGFTHIQVKRATDRLIKRNLLTREFRTIEYGDMKMGNVMFIEPISENVKLITDEILEDPYLLYSKQGITTESIGNNDRVNTYTDTTTDTTTRESKDSLKAFSRKRLQSTVLDSQSASLGIQAEQAELDSVDNETEQAELDSVDSKTAPPPSQILRSKDHSYANKPTAKKPDYICPKVNKPFVDAWCEITGKKYRGFNTPTYSGDCIAIGKLRRGTFFDKDVMLDVNPDFYGYKLDDINEWRRILKLFKLMRSSVDYYPKSKSTIKRLTIKSFLYNEGTPNGEKSYFIKCVVDGIKKVSSTNIIKDPNPEYTEQVVEMCKEEFGWDLSNGQRSVAIRCASKLIEFYSENSEKIQNFNYHFQFPHQQIGELIEMLKYNASNDRPPKPMYLYGDLTYKTLLPEHLKRVGSMS